MSDLAAQFLTFAEKQGTTVPLMIGHRLMGSSLLLTGHLAEGRTHFDIALALYDPASIVRWRRDLAKTVRYSLSYRSWAMWFLGYPEAALGRRGCAQLCARDGAGPDFNTHCIHRIIAQFSAEITRQQPQKPKNLSLANEKGSMFWKARECRCRVGFCPDQQGFRRS